jgi:outer membrane protein assembly factor BamB
VLLVSLANGKVVALEKRSGAQLWTFHSGAPLLSSTARAPGGGDGLPADGATWRC